MKSVDVIGWTASCTLVWPVGWQVYTQWKSGKSAGLSRWLFVGQIGASIGFLIYSWLVENWVFVTTNLFMLVTACLGQYLFLRNQTSGKPMPTTARIHVRGKAVPKTSQTT